MSRTTEPTTMNYVECDVPGDMTLIQWRAQRVAARSRRRRLRLPVLRIPRLAI